MKPLVRRIIGIAIFVGFGTYGAGTTQRWLHWPKAPRALTIADAVSRPEEPWVQLTDGESRCDYVYTEDTFSYYTLTDGRIVVLDGYEGKPACPPPALPSGAFREASSMLLDQLTQLGFNRDQIAPPTSGAPLTVYAIFTHEGPGNFRVTVPLLFALALIGLAYALTAKKATLSSFESSTAMM
jgi:hypothetical protein